jgi:diketogulonate reductase-like aldo/keto reductase
MDDPTLVSIAGRHRKSPAQVLVRYSLQKGWVPLPKSVRPDRIQENIDVFDFELSDAEMEVLDAKDMGPKGAKFPKNVSK